MTMDELHRKQDRLRTILRDMGCAAVAFSAGSDEDIFTAHDASSTADRITGIKPDAIRLKDGTLLNEYSMVKRIRQ